MELLIEFAANQYGMAAEDLGKIVSLVFWVMSLLLAPIGLILAFIHYRRKRFTDQITFSGNIFDHKKGGEELYLLIRNPQMLPIDDVLPANPVFRLNLRRAILRCTPEDPFIRMSASDMDVLQPSIINAVSMEFAASIYAKMAGADVEVVPFYIAVTFEKDGSMRNQKIRIMIISEKELLRFKDPDFGKDVHFERSHHAYRMYTLRKMYEQWQKERTISNDEFKIVRSVDAYGL